MNANMMYTREYVRKALQDRQIVKVSEATGLSRFTLYRFRDNVGNVSYDTVKALSDYFMDSE